MRHKRYAQSPTRRAFLKAAAVSPALGLAGLSFGAEDERRRPNVVLIMADDLGYECIGANGSATYETPHLDELARTGARFEHCYSQPLCTPTRVQIMTGRYFSRNYTQFGQLRQGEPTFGHMMKDAGYATGVFGKWQLQGRGGQTAPQAGFGDYCLWNYTGTTRQRYADASLAYIDPATGAEQVSEFTGEYGPDVCTRRLCDFARRAVASGTPFLAYYPMILTHPPFVATPDSAVWKEDPHAQGSEYFGDMVAYMDTLVGRIVAALGELGVRDETLIMFTGDNGTAGGIVSEMRDGRSIKAGKGFHSDAGTHVPLIAHWRGTIGPGQVRDDLVDTTDFLPTIADATGAAPRTPPGDGVLDGRSFLPQLAGRPGRPREWVLVDYTEQRQD
ncbi:MAG: sulfatase-like hydrolase/transferase, partial [Candidatus Brocadiaceae bacterium]